MHSNFRMRLSSWHLVTKVFDLVEFAQPLAREVSTYPSQIAWIQGSKVFSPPWTFLSSQKCADTDNSAAPGANEGMIATFAAGRQRMNVPTKAAAATPAPMNPIRAT